MQCASREKNQFKSILNIFKPIFKAILNLKFVFLFVRLRRPKSAIFRSPTVKEDLKREVDPATTAGRLVIDAGSAARSPATGRWQDRGDLVDVVVDGSGKSHNKTMKTMTGTVVDLDGCIDLRPPPRSENRIRLLLFLINNFCCFCCCSLPVKFINQATS